LEDAVSEYLILIYDAEEPYASFTPELWREVAESHRRFAEQVVERCGAVVSSRVLQPTASAASFRDGVATEGPFVQTPEAFCGFYLIDATDDQHAREIAALCPAKFGGVEVRPVRPSPVKES
jgi:hypothetical protein